MTIATAVTIRPWSSQRRGHVRALAQLRPAAGSSRTNYVTRSIALAPGDMLAALHDGVTEPKAPDPLSRREASRADDSPDARPSARSVVETSLNAWRRFAKGAPSRTTSMRRGRSERTMNPIRRSECLASAEDDPSRAVETCLDTEIVSATTSWPQQVRRGARHEAGHDRRVTWCALPLLVMAGLVPAPTSF